MCICLCHCICVVCACVCVYVCPCVYVCLSVHLCTFLHIMHASPDINSAVNASHGSSSHVTRYTSHVTRHTSHVSGHTFALSSSPKPENQKLRLWLTPPPPLSAPNQRVMGGGMRKVTRRKNLGEMNYPVRIRRVSLRHAARLRSFSAAALSRAFQRPLWMELQSRRWQLRVRTL